MVRNIKTAFAKRINILLNMLGFPPIFTLKENLQPTIDYHKSMKRHLLFVDSNIAGNVVIYIQPGTGYKLDFLYGNFYLTTGVTVANRQIRFSYMQRIPTIMLHNGYENVTPQAASLNVNYELERHGRGNDPFGGQSINEIVPLIDHSLYEKDELRIMILEGQAGDDYKYAIRAIESPVYSMEE